MPGLAASAGLEEKIWLRPIEDRSRLDSTREGILSRSERHWRIALSLGSCLLVFDYTGRLFREGKAVAGRSRQAST